MKKFFLMFVLIIISFNAKASPAEYAKYFKIDLTADLPTIEDLKNKYIFDDPDHDRKYEHNFSIGTLFDKIFRKTITMYGGTEKRLKTAEEEAFIDMLNSIPKETWQYIGPYLHTVAGMSERILNMPGIKETKNKFPTRIAPRLKDMENLEFLSPHLYFLLMPEVWPEFYENQEVVQIPQKIATPKVKRDPSFFALLKSLIPRDEFADESLKLKKTASDLRNVNITPSTPLTSGDVKAFLGTISPIHDYANQGRKENLLQISRAGTLLDIYEAEQGTALPINSLKDVVNPCQREVQKIIVAGKYQEFFSVVSKSGFSPETWAVTCDKTLKAYRVATMHSQALVALNQFKFGLYDEYLKNNLNTKNQGYHFATIQSIVEMHKTSMNDVLAVRKYIPQLRDEFTGSASRIISSPIVY
ncbi:MAG: hypothetical protein R3Y43_04365 [Alphaproteobacteria bacterium]